MDDKKVENSPVATLAFKDIALGDKVNLEIKITPELVDSFAEMTGDVNPLHTSKDFARQKGFEDRVAHGLLVASFFSTIAGTLLPGRDCILQSAKFEFKNPVLAGTALKLEAQVAQKVESVRTLVLDISAKDSSGKTVLSGRMQAGMP